MSKAEMTRVVRVYANRIYDEYVGVPGLTWIGCVDEALADLSWKRRDVDYEALKVRNP